jgi:hypothetical protein
LLRLLLNMLLLLLLLPKDECRLRRLPNVATVFCRGVDPASVG